MKKGFSNYCIFKYEDKKFKLVEGIRTNVLD